MSQQIQITGGAKVRDLQDVIIGTSGVLSSVAFNVANGVPKLDSNGKILVAQLPNSVMEYKGVWNAATNSPTLTNGGAFNQGDVYLCDTAGTVNFGSGSPISFIVGDQAIYSGSVWQKAGGATGTVTSVAVTESGDSLNITGSPITTSGTINIGFNGTNLQYVNGAGNLTTFPILTGYVPYTGATQDVDLGAFSLNGKSLHIKGTAGNGHLGLKHQSAAATGSANESLIYADSLGDLSWQNANLYLSKFITSANSANRSYTFPNATCNIPDDSLVVHLAGTETITGAKTFSAYTTFTSTVDITSGLTFSNSGFTLVLQPPTLSVNRTVTFPNATGTLALTSDISYPVTSVFGRTGAVVATSGDYTTAQVTEVTNLYFTDARARLALSFAAGSGAYNSTTGVITIPTNNNQITNGAGYITGNQTITLSGDVSGSGTTAITTTIGALKVTNAMLAGSIDLTTKVTGLLPDGNISSAATWNAKQNAITLTTTGTSGAATFSANTLNIPDYGSALSGYLPLTGGTLTGALTITNANINLSNAYSLTARNNANSAFISLIQRNTSDKVSIDADGYGTVLGGALSGTSATFAGLLTINVPTDNTTVGIFHAGGGTANRGLKISTFASVNDNAGVRLDAQTTTGGATLIFATAGVDKMTLNTSGNLGLNFTPSATGSNAKALQLTNYGTLSGNGNIGSMSMAANAYESADNSWNRVNGTSAGLYQISYTGQHSWYYTGSASAGSGITWTQAMTLDANGQLGVKGTAVLAQISLGISTPNTTSSKIAVYDNTGNNFWGIGLTSYSSVLGLGLFSGTSATATPQAILTVSGRLLIGTTTEATYLLDVNGTGRFSSSVTANQGVFKNSGVPAILAYRDLDVTVVGAAGQGIEFGARNGATTFVSGAAIYGVLNNPATTGSMVFQTLTAGSLTTQLTIASTGAATFSSSVTAATLIFKDAINSNSYGFRGLSGIVTLDAGSVYPTGWNFQYGGTASSALYINGTGNVGIGTSSPSDRLNVVVGANGNNTRLDGPTSGLIFQTNASSVDIISYGGTTAAYREMNFATSATTALSLATTGAATFSSTCTATGFFESSDMRIKTLIQDNYQTKGIASITPKLYTKNGKVELGYYAQDFVGILDSAVSKGSDDMLSLSYREVLVAKVYALEQRIKELENK